MDTLLNSVLVWFRYKAAATNKCLGVSYSASMALERSFSKKEGAAKLLTYTMYWSNAGQELNCSAKY